MLALHFRSSAFSIGDAGLAVISHHFSRSHSPQGSTLWIVIAEAVHFHVCEGLTLIPDEESLRVHPESQRNRAQVFPEYLGPCICYNSRLQLMAPLSCLHEGGETVNLSFAVKPNLSSAESLGLDAEEHFTVLVKR